MVYSNGYRATFTINEAGVVVSSVRDGGSGTGQLVESTDANCPGSPCARLEGIFALGKYELLTLENSNLIKLKHWQDPNTFCCTGEGTKGMYYQ